MAKPPISPARRAPFIRIRTLLLLGLVLAAGVWVTPRALAAWRLQTVATELADYALCMVGPTGPALIRDSAPEFEELVRRRLVAAPANDRPFSACAAQARDLTGSGAIERAHRATAASFVEYGAEAADRAEHGSTELGVRALRVDARVVTDLMREAWPFVRGGYLKLVQPSISAHEAVHPVELPRAAVGRGLPAVDAYYRTVRADGDALLLAVGQGANLSAFESRDQGATWNRTGTERVLSFAERCVADDQGHAFTLSVGDDGRSTWLNSLGPDGPATAVELAPANVDVFASACDQGVFVAALRQPGSSKVSLMACPHRAPCASMPLPRLSSSGLEPRYPLDIARARGTTIVATPMHGLVRVSSTRDNGRTWTPFLVAYDRSAQSPALASATPPGRLLAMGSRVLLYGGADDARQSYPLLFSDDQGASWRGAISAPSARPSPARL